MFNKEKSIVSKEKFFRNRVILFGLFSGLIINIGVWLYLALKVKSQSDPIFLHYNIYFGVDLIGEWYQIFIMPLTGLIIYFINLYFSYIIYRREKIISYSIISLTAVIQLIILLASFLIVRQNV